MSEEANRYYQSGLEQFRGGQYQEALPDCQKALDIYQQIGHGFGEARSLRIIGNIYSKLEKYREALDSYQQELAIYRRTKSRAVEADSLCNIGDIHSKLKDYREALYSYEQASEIYRELTDRRREANSRYSIGIIYDQLKNDSEALDSLQQAVEIYQRLGDREGEAKCRDKIRNIHDRRDDSRQQEQREANRHHQLGLEQFGEGLYQEALSSFQEALQIYRKIGYAPGEANALYWTGTSYGSLKDKSKAIASLQQAIEIYQRLGDREGEARCRDKISNIDSGLDDSPKDTDSHQQERGAANRHHQLGLEQFGEGLYQEALSNFQGALGIHRKLGYASGEASSLSLIAGSYHNLGEYRRALDSLQQALEIYRETGDRPLEAKSLYNIANIYNDNLQDYPKAIESFQQALLIFQELGDREGEAKSRNKIRNIGDRPESKVERLVLQPDTKEPVRVPSVSPTPTVDLPPTPRGILLIQALVIGGAILVLVILGSLALPYFLGTTSRVNVDLPGSEANSLQDSSHYEDGEYHYNDKEYHKALDSYQQAVVICQRISDRFCEARSLNRIGLVYHNLGEYRKAIDFFKQALVTFQAIPDRLHEAHCLDNIGNVYHYALNDYPKALDSYQQARDIYREIGEDEKAAGVLKIINRIEERLYRSDEATSLYNIGINDIVARITAKPSITFGRREPSIGKSAIAKMKPGVVA